MKKSRSITRIIGIGIGTIVLLILFYSLIAYSAYRIGIQESISIQKTEVAEKIQRQYELSQDDLDSGRLSIASGRITWILEQTPEHPDVLALQETVIAKEEASEIVIPTPEVSPTPTPTRSPKKTVTPYPTEIPDPEFDSAVADKELKKIQKNIDDEEWQDLIDQVVAFQIEYPNYQRYRTDTILYDAYLNAGYNLTFGSKASLGITYLDEASKLGKLPPYAVDQRYYAQLYLQALSYSGVRWDITILNFQELCANVPLYQNSCNRLYNAYATYGQQLVTAERPCEAVDQLTYAVQFSSDSQADLTEAVQLCEEYLANPPVELNEDGTPIAVFTDTVGVTNTVGLTNTVELEEGDEDDTIMEEDEGNKETTPTSTPTPTATRKSGAWQTPTPTRKSGAWQTPTPAFE